jgi:hypothetical protein
MGAEPESVREVAAVPPKGKRPKRFLEKNVNVAFFDQLEQ